MRVLNVEHWVLPRLRHRQVQVELHLRVTLAHQHREPHAVPAHPLQQVRQRHVGARPLGHPHRHTAAQHVHDLAQHDIERRPAIPRHRLRRRLHPGDVAAVIGAPDVDHLLRTARHLVGMIRDVIGEIGVAAVRFPQRTVHIVSVSGRAEQRLLPRLPIIRQLALRRLQHALVDQALTLQPVDHPVRIATGHQRPLGREHIHGDTERRQVRPDRSHHRRDGEIPHRHEPHRRVRHRAARPGQRRPVRRQQVRADRQQILTFIL